MPFPTDEVTLNIIKESLTSGWEVDPDTGEHSKPDGVPSFYQVLDFLSGPQELSTEDEDLGGAVAVYATPSYHFGDVILALIDEIENLRAYG